MLRSIDRSLCPMGWGGQGGHNLLPPCPPPLWDACHEFFCIFGDFYALETQDTEVTKSLHSWDSKNNKISFI